MPGDRAGLLFPGLSSAPVADSPALMPDAAKVCQCNNVTKGQIRACWRPGAATWPEWRPRPGPRPDAEPAATPWRASSAGCASRKGFPYEQDRRRWVRADVPARRDPGGQGLRRPDHRDREEPRPAYDRVALYLPASPWRTSPTRCPRGRDGLSSRVTGIDRRPRGHPGRRRAEPYDVLVLATGSAPFVPPVPGAEHAFVYRTIDDLTRSGWPPRTRSRSWSAAGCSAWRPPTRCAPSG